jgi:hypothetical protein
MRKEVREQIKYAESLGFTLDGINGSGHYRLTHAKGEVTVSATPGAYSSFANGRSEMRRIAGVGSDSPKAATYKKSNLGSGFDMAVAVRESRRRPQRPDRANQQAKRELKWSLKEVCQELEQHREHISALELGIRKYGETPGMRDLLAERYRMFDLCLSAAERIEADLASLLPPS